MAVSLLTSLSRIRNLDCAALVNELFCWAEMLQQVKEKTKKARLPAYLK